MPHVCLEMILVIISVPVPCGCIAGPGHPEKQEKVIISARIFVRESDSRTQAFSEKIHACPRKHFPGVVQTGHSSLKIQCNRSTSVPIRASTEFTSKAYSTFETPDPHRSFVHASLRCCNEL